MKDLDKWFTISWWQYLLRKPEGNDYKDVSWIVRFICRSRNHPCGIVYYNPAGLEPDYHCKNCGDDLG
jgi:hypothetical protein